MFQTYEREDFGSYGPETTRAVIAEAYQNGLEVTGKGKVADYIPELAKADGTDFGICARFPDGEEICFGDVEKRFTIQSISKVVNLLAAFKLFGSREVFRHVMAEPSGDAFNSMTKVDLINDKPYNPMINAGAIEVASLLAGSVSFEELLGLTREVCMDPDIVLNEDVYRSESETGDRNRSIAYLLKSKGVLCSDVDKTLDLYFKMCSLNVTARSLAGLGLVLSCDGVNPFTGEKFTRHAYVRELKSIMFTCGMYDYSGEFGLKVGVPAKSGVGGGIVCSTKGPMGFGLYGPALDEHGNSIAGITAMEHISHLLKLHVFDYRSDSRF